MYINKDLEHKYDFQILEELKPGYEIYYYPGAEVRGGKNGIIVQIDSEKKTWMGVFAPGTISKNGLYGVYASPHFNKLCVVANGAGYFVSSDNPKEWEEIKSIPIIYTGISKAKNVIIFADYTELIAYDNTGVRWKTKRLSWDGLKIIELSDDYIKGEYYDIRTEKNELFKVDLISGINRGRLE